MEEKSASIPVGVVVQRRPGVTRWARYAWRAVAVLPGAGPAEWQELRRSDGPAGPVIEYHAGTLPLTLWRTDTEAYRVGLSTEPPSVFVVLRGETGTRLSLFAVTASPFEAQDYGDTGEEIVERVPMPPGLVAWIRSFVERHHVEEPFVKRRRDTVRTDRTEDGRGDARIAQLSDVYRRPRGGRDRLQ